MRLIQYSPDQFERLAAAGRAMGEVPGLLHREFVDYYYASSDHCRLFLCEEDDQIVATIGVENARFQCDGQSLDMSMASNYHSRHPGAGGFLYMQWMKMSPFAFGTGGSSDTHRILKKMKWTYFSGLRKMVLNRPPTVLPTDAAWRGALKHLAAQLVPRPSPSARLGRLSWDELKEITVSEQRNYTDELTKIDSPFNFRLDPSVEYLRWRFALGLPFTTYRLYHVLKTGQLAGYVILNENEKRVMVTQCDGICPKVLSYGVMLSLAELTQNDRFPREVSLSTCSPIMQKMYQEFGFQDTKQERTLAMGSVRHRIEFRTDTSNWLVNLGWNDNLLIKTASVSGEDQRVPRFRIARCH